MSKENIFVDGMIIKHPHERVPNFIKATMSLNVEKLKEFMDKHNVNGWINIDIKEGRNGKLYASLNMFNPDSSYNNVVYNSNDNNTTQEYDNIEDDQISF